MAKFSLGLVASAGKCRPGGSSVTHRSRGMTVGVPPRCCGTSSKPRLSQRRGGAAAAQSMSAIKA